MAQRNGYTPLPQVDSVVLQVENSEATTPTSEVSEGASSASVTHPPDYETATHLPSYEEAERSKAEEAAATAANTGESPKPDEESVELGTDAMFICTFGICFLFNWIGLLASMCLSQTIAARFGAISGFGLSLVKWLWIMRTSEWTSGVVTETWIWWLLVLMGFTIFLRGCTQYIRIRHYWHKFTPTMRNRLYTWI